MRRPEQTLQRAVLDHLRWRGMPGLFVFHYPAGGWRSSGEAAILKGLGVTPGVPDLLILHQGKLHALELKSARGRKDLRAIYGAHARNMLSWLNQLQHARARTVIFVAVLEKNTDELNISTWQPQIEGAKTGRELPAIVDEIVTMQWVDFGDRKPVRAFVCVNPNAWGYPAKDRSGKLDQFEPPNLGALIEKLTGPGQRKPFITVSPEQSAQT